MSGFPTECWCEKEGKELCPLHGEIKKVKEELDEN